MKIALAGNPNSGKTCIFNNLTGNTQRVGNYPGVTVEFAEGTTKINDEKVQVIDLPGTYSLTAYSEDEVVARDYILKNKPDVVVNVVDASNLERNLYLTTQLLELQVPTVLVLNMYDVAKAKGFSIDTDLLGKLLGIKVVKAVAKKREGMEEIKQACVDTLKEGTIPREVSYPHELENILPPLKAALESHSQIKKDYHLNWFMIKLLEGDPIVLETLESYQNIKALDTYQNIETIKEELAKAKESLEKHSGEDSVTAVVEARYAFASGAFREVLKQSEEHKKQITQIVDTVACNRVLGPLMLLGIVYALFKFTFFMAEDLTFIPTVDGLVSPVTAFEMFFEWLAGIGGAIEIPWLQSLLVDGIVGGVGGVMGFVPIIFFMFMFLSVLEDSGYIARVAFILDRILRTFGLQGKSILALIVSGGLGAGGCAVPGVMATRTMREEKDRLVTILVAPLMNCGAKMPVFAMLTAAFFAENQGEMLLLIWALSWVFALVFAVLIRKFVVKGEQTPFVMELPVYHMPTFRGVMMDTWQRTYSYLKKAATIILAINVILWALIYYPRNDATEFDAQREKASQTLLNTMAQTEFASLFTTDNYEETLGALEVEEGAEVDNQYKALASALSNDKNTSATAVTTYSDKTTSINNEEQQAQFSGSFAGTIGMTLEPISKLAGFDWRDNIALIGGFAAKEVIVGYLGTVYSMGEVDTEDTGSLSERLQKDENWSPLRAFAMIIFIMIYAPCFVTVAAIRKETNTKWAIFSTAYTTVLGFILATVVYQIGGLFI